MTAVPARLVPAGQRGLAATVAVVTGVALPVFLVGTLAVQIRASLHFTATRLGVAVALFYLLAALCSVPFAGVVERWGALRVLRGSGIFSGIAMLGVAAVARSWLTLLPVLALAGVASSASQPAANLYLSQTVSPGRQGLAFGIKQSAIPTANLLGGLAVPALALTVGWRWAFVAGAALAIGSAAALPRSPGQRPAPRGVTPAPDSDTDPAPAPAPALIHPPLAPLLVLGGAFFLGLMAASSLAAFLVTSATRSGLGVAAAGYVAAVAGGFGLIARLVVGAAADRRGGRHFPVVAAMLAVGALGYAGLAAGTALRSPVLFVPAAAVAFGVGWGWNGLFNFAVVRTHPTAAAWATGVTQTGGRLGSVVGPVAFGLLADHVSFAVAWLFSAAAAAASAALMLVGRRVLLRSREPQPGVPAVATGAGLDGAAPVIGTGTS